MAQASARPAEHDPFDCSVWAAAARLRPDPAAIAALRRLSRREREVLRLLVEHRTDQEIAEALFISYRTVTTHVAHILNKLGVDSRRDAAAIALYHRLP